MNYCYSHDEERYHDDLDDVVSDCLDMMDPTRIEVGTVLHLWRGEIVPVTPQMLVPHPDDLIGEHMKDQLYEHVGDVDGDWPKWTVEQAVTFNDDFWRWLDVWMTKHNDRPISYKVENVRPYNLRITAVRDAEDGDVDWEEVQP
jgi:hypothetical protein